MTQNIAKQIEYWMKIELHQLAPSSELHLWHGDNCRKWNHSAPRNLFGREAVGRTNPSHFVATLWPQMELKQNSPSTPVKDGPE